MAEQEPERFVPSSGRVMGVLGLALALLVVGLGLLDPDSGIAGWGVATAAAVGVLVWAAVLRPRISLGEDHLELRNMTETVSIPLAAIEELAVRQVTAVRVGDRRFVSPALGKSRRQLNRSERGAGPGMVQRLRSTPGDARTTVDYADFVEERIRRRMEDARTRHRVRPGSAEQLALAGGVRRAPAWPEIGALVVLGVTALVTALL